MTTTRGQHLIGQEIGSCVLERVLGYGGSSAVYLARSLTSEEQVAVKVFLPRSTLDGQMRKSFYERFLKEAEAASQLDHPNILLIYAYGEQEGIPYIIMPYMAGGTLAEYVQQHGPLALEEALHYLEQIADALDYVHKQKWVHCDVKPANILLDAAGNTALSDFGIVHVLQTEEEASASDKSQKKGGSETLMGTLDYMSPEQALSEKLDGRSDVYSLGATLYALLTGEPPFQADQPIKLALMHVHEAPTPVGLLRADVTPQIDFVMSRALAKWPEERFQTAGGFATAFKLAVKEAHEKTPASLSPVRATKQQTGENTPVPPGIPAIAQPIVRIERLTRQRFRPWRTSLLLGLVALLVVACLLTALFIRTVNASRSPGASSSPTPTSPSGPLDLLAQDKGDWPQSRTFFFQQNSYIVENTLTQGDPAVTFYQNHNYGDFRLQVTTTEASGPLDGADYYGLLFRAPLDQSRYYLFDVTSWNQGQYVFLRYDGGSHWAMLGYGSLKNFSFSKRGANTLSVEARGTAFTLFINDKQAGKTYHDSSKKAFASGEIGLIVEKRSSEVAFSHLYITAPGVPEKG